MALDSVDMKNLNPDPVFAKEVLLHTIAIRSLIDSRTASSLAERTARVAGLNRTAARSFAIATCELATNIARHADEGSIRIYISEGAVKVVAEDRGPGIADPALAKLDGHSRGRRLTVDDPRRDGIGCGLGAVLRLMDEVEVETQPSVGTRITALKKKAARR